MGGIGQAIEVVSRGVGHVLDAVVPGAGTALSSVVSDANTLTQQGPPPEYYHYQQQQAAYQQAEAQQQQQQQQRNLQLAQSYADGQSRTKAINEQFNAKQQQRQDLLRRTLASQRARFGAMGIGSGGGSAAAVLNGFRQSSAQDEATDRLDTNLSLEDINRSLDYRYQQNLLDTQAETQRLNYQRERLAADREQTQNMVNARNLRTTRGLLNSGIGTMAIGGAGRLLSD
ncbi:MAG: hypothetical protein H7840_04080 [Alphaproteobacteria bacterium]